jgi:predicted DNA-binding antitoxin AbrB/MazE fold protein
MSLEIEVTYENGVLKPDRPLPLADRQRVTVRIQTRENTIRQSAGLVPLPAENGAVEYLTGPENVPWER